MTSSHVTTFGGYKNPKKIKRILDSTTTYEKYLLSPFWVWAILVWEYWNPPKICNKKVTTRLWYAKGPYWHTFGSIGPRALARGPMPPKVCQYGPLAYHSRVITYNYWLGYFGGVTNRVASIYSSCNNWNCLTIIPVCLNAHVFYNLCDLFCTRNSINSLWN